MSEDPPLYGSRSDSDLKRRRMVSVLRAGADWLASVTEEKLPLVLKRLEPLIDELARSASLDQQPRP